MKKIILLDPNFSADPISDKLLESGFKVLRVGKLIGTHRVRKNEFFFELDYSNVKSVLNLFQEERVYQIIPGCTDLSFKTSNSIGIKLNLPGYFKQRSIDPMLSKIRLSTFLEDIDVPHPTTLGMPLKSMPKSLKNHDWIAKPNIGFSGKDIVKLNFNEKNTRFEKIRKLIEENRIILQEFVAGPLFSFSGILRDSRIIQSNVVSEECIDNNWKVDLSYIERSVPIKVKNQLIEIAEKISRVNMRSTGLIHMQFILTDTGPKVIELIERMPGDLYSQLIEWSEKANFVSGYLSNFLPNHVFTENLGDCKKSLIRVTINLNSLQQFIKKNSHKYFELLYFTNTKRSTSINKRENQEVVAFLNFTDDESLKTWVGSEQKYFIYKY